LNQVQQHFPEARVTGYEKMVTLMTNHPKDRHVLAAAVQCGAHVIVTANIRDFPSDSLLEWGIEARHPDQFLLNLLESYPEEIMAKLHDQAATIGRTLPRLLNTLQNAVPEFATVVVSKLGLELSNA
jgi:hypothetical protein